MPDPPVLRALRLGDAPGPWRALGFAVEGGVCRIGTAALELTGAGGGALGWTLARGDELAGPAPAHPNGIVRIDHVVLVTDALPPTLAGLEALGLRVRRHGERAGRAQAFLWLGDVILEVVEGAGPERIWGVTLVAADLDATAVRLGDALGPIRPAVQPGRRIATVVRAAGLGLPVAIMSPHVRGFEPSAEAGPPRVDASDANR